MAQPEFEDLNSSKSGKGTASNKGGSANAPASETTQAIPPQGEPSLESQLANARRLLIEAGELVPDENGNVVQAKKGEPSSNLTAHDLINVLRELKSEKSSADSGVEIAKAIERALSRNTTDGVVLNPDVLAEQYDKNDILDEPIIFFRPCGGKFIDLGGVRADGTFHFPPFRDRYNKVVPMIWTSGPEFIAGYDQKGAPVINKFAQYICKSKKELEYIRNHIDYGTYIRESVIDQAYTTNAFIQALNNARNKVTQLSPVDRIMFARERGIETEGRTPGEWYNDLVMSLAKQEVASMNIQYEAIGSMFDKLKAFPNADGLSSTNAVVNADIKNVKGRSSMHIEYKA